MKRLFGVVFAFLFVGTLAAEALHHHESQPQQASCAVCAATTQAREAFHAAPVAAQSAGFTVLAVQAAPSYLCADAVSASARAPPASA
jgi:hypothetical protein